MLLICNYLLRVNFSMYIYYSKKVTKNLGNYENIVITLGLKDKVKFDSESLDDCYWRLKHVTDQKIEEELQRIDLTEQVKSEISKLLKISNNNSHVIRNLLAAFTVTKVGNLNLCQLNTFIIKLKQI